MERSISLGGDLTLAVRQLRRHPAFTAVTIGTLALGIGVTTAMFSVVHRLLLDPIPYRDGDRIVRLYEGMKAAISFGGEQKVLVSPSISVARAWRRRSHTLEQVVWMGGEYSATLGRGTESQLVQVKVISADVPSFLGVRPVLGRDFVAGETEQGAAPTALLGYGFWRTQFGGARDVIGRAVVVDDTARTIVGVMPPGIALPGEQPAQVWLPLVVRSDSDVVIPWARLRRGVSLGDAQRELAGILATTQPPSSRFQLSAEVVRLRDYLGPHVERALVFVAGAVALVLLIACGNVANLLLARAAGRQRELSMRTALGATRWRLVRQFAAESACVTLVAGALGVLLAWRMMAAVDATRPAALDALDAARLDTTTLLWTVGVSVATAVLFGTVPLLIGAGRNPADVLKGVSRSVSLGRDARRLRGALIVGEVALSVALLVGAGLLIRAVRSIEREDVGFNPHNLVAITLFLSTPRYANPLAVKPVVDGLANEVRLLPGVTAVTLAGGAPPMPGIALGGIELEDRPGGSVDSVKSFGFNQVQPDYFKVLGLPIVAGRIFDGDTAAHAAMISTEMARQYWPRGNALGKRFRSGPGSPWHVIVGIVGETTTPGASLQLPDQIYEPFPYGRGATFIVRTRGTTPTLVASATRLVNAVDPKIRVAGRSVDAEFAALFAGRRFTMLLLSMFAGLALVLSVVGLYGVIAYSVEQRTREMGVRMALGATPAAITRLVVVDGAKRVGAGLLVGALITAVLDRLARPVLAEVGQLQPALFVAMAALLSAAALVAAYVPSRRAARVDPAITLRAE